MAQESDKSQDDAVWGGAEQFDVGGGVNDVEGNYVPPEGEGEKAVEEDGKESSGEEVSEAVRQETERMKREILQELKAAQQGPVDYGQVDGSKGYGKASEEDDFETEFFANPKEALKKREEQLRREIVQELKGEYQQEKAQEEFWNAFYAENSHLKNAKDVVQAVFHQNYSSLADRPVAEARRELAKLANQRVAEIAKSVGGGGQKSTRARAESGAGPNEKAGGAETSGEESGPASLSEALRKRREGFRRAAGKQAS